ncbi:MAG: YkgJ family cysteine cluster protein [Treponema sp.]|nr:YkgJ family cysteine cluster protein [Treponema sp.]
MKKLPFYASGLKFSCKRCSSCCRYDAGFVFLSENDMNSLASALKIDTNVLLNLYCRWVTDFRGEEVLSLKEKSNKDCILWGVCGCTVYDSRPLQCVTFPFWESIVSSCENWELAASGCPGINQGKLHTKNEINENMKMRDQQPIIKREAFKSGIEKRSFRSTGGE